MMTKSVSRITFSDVGNGKKVNPKEIRPYPCWNCGGLGHDDEGLCKTCYGVGILMYDWPGPNTEIGMNPAAG